MESFRWSVLPVVIGLGAFLFVTEKMKRGFSSHGGYWEMERFIEEVEPF
jgi:hypothetical protein